MSILNNALRYLQKLENKEKKNIYNVFNNDKNATPIKQDLESIENAILLEKGRENPKTKKGYGVKHILKHILDKNNQDYVTQDEVLNLGNSIRKYLAQHKEPFIDKNNARLYEWQDEKGVNFRVVVSDIGKDSTTMVESKDLSLPTQRIITFYSDRNNKNNTKMDFKNPQLKELPQERE